MHGYHNQTGTITNETSISSDSYNQAQQPVEAASTEEIMPSHSVSAVKHMSKQFVGLCVIPVYLYVKATPQTRFKVYAMLDYCSQGTIISEDLIQMLKSARVLSTDITVKTINGEESMPTIAVDDLAVICTEDFGNHYSEFEIELPTTYTQTELPFGTRKFHLLISYRSGSICNQYCHTFQKLIHKFQLVY